MRIVLAGGGTGGHIYPAVSIARAILQKNPKAEIHFVGAYGGLEQTLVPKEGFPLHLLKVGKLNRNAGRAAQIKTLLMMPLSLVQAALLVLKLRPALVIGVGGYASAPFVLLSALMGRKCVLFEPNAYPGMANRMLARFAHITLLVFEKAAEILHARQTVRVGLPVRQDLVMASRKPREPHDNLRILVFGGSQGARAINKVIMDAVAAGSPWLADVEIVHQTGVHDFAEAKQIYEKPLAIRNFKIEAKEFLHDMPQRYLWADIVICRAGASTVAELIVMNEPALFIPLPTAADDHQTQNAKVLADAGAARLCKQSEWSVDYLRALVVELRGNQKALQNMRANLRKLETPNAADQIASICLDLANKGLNH